MLIHIHPSFSWFTHERRSTLLNCTHISVYVKRRKTIQVPRAPLSASWRMLPRYSMISRIISESITFPSLLLRTHAPSQIPPAAFVFIIQPVFAGCYQSLLVDGSSRRYLCRSSDGCSDPYPGGSLQCSYPFLPVATSAFPLFRQGRFSLNFAQRLLYEYSLSRL